MILIMAFSHLNYGHGLRNTEAILPMKEDERTVSFWQAAFSNPWSSFMECTLNPRVLIRDLCCCFRLLLPSKWFKLHILAILGFCGWEVGLNAIGSSFSPISYVVSNMSFAVVSLEACWVSVPSQQQKQARAIPVFTSLLALVSNLVNVS